MQLHNDVRSDTGFSSNYITTWKSVAYVKVSRDLESWIFFWKQYCGGNSLVYGIYVVEISAYMLKYQHWWKISIVVMKFQHIGPSQTPPTSPRAFIWYIYFGVPKRNFEVDIMMSDQTTTFHPIIKQNGNTLRCHRI